MPRFTHAEYNAWDPKTLFNKYLSVAGVTYLGLWVKEQKQCVTCSLGN